MDSVGRAELERPELRRREDGQHSTKFNNVQHAHNATTNSFWSERRGDVAQRGLNYSFVLVVV